MYHERHAQSEDGSSICDQGSTAEARSRFHLGKSRGVVGVSELEKAEAADVQRAITKRYGPIGRLFDVYLKLRGVDKKSVGIEIKAV